MKLVRRFHLYTGLLLLPWVIFFGFSGVLFNHSTWLGSAEVTNVGKEEAKRRYGWQPVDATQLADDLLVKLNSDSAGVRYERVQNYTPTLEGGIAFQGMTEEGEVTVSLSPGTGRASVASRKNPGGTKRPGFDGKSIQLLSFPVGEVEAIAGKMLEDSGLTPVGELKRSERGGTELRFQVRSPEEEQTWNLIYNAATGKLSGRAAEERGELDLRTVLGRLHKLHDYPENAGARWLWSAFADATGATMVFWGLSGLVMWWQMKPTRVLGICGLSFAVVAALLVFGGTFNSIFFGPAPQRGGNPRPAGQSGEEPGKQTPSLPPLEQGATGKRDNSVPRIFEAGENTSPGK